jgi:hypothetical protein
MEYHNVIFRLVNVKQLAVMFHNDCWCPIPSAKALEEPAESSLALSPKSPVVTERPTKKKPRCVAGLE